MNPPVRACRLVLDLQADTRADLVNALENIATMIDRRELTTGCSGGYSSGYTYDYAENERPTHAEYHQQLRAYMAHRAAKETEPAPCEDCGERPAIDGMFHKRGCPQL